MKQQTEAANAVEVWVAAFSAKHASAELAGNCTAHLGDAHLYVESHRTWARKLAKHTGRGRTVILGPVRRTDAGASFDLLFMHRDMVEPLTINVREGVDAYSVFEAWLSAFDAAGLHVITDGVAHCKITAAREAGRAVLRADGCVNRAANAERTRLRALADRKRARLAVLVGDTCRSVRRPAHRRYL